MCCNPQRSRSGPSEIQKPQRKAELPVTDKRGTDPFSPHALVRAILHLLITLSASLLRPPQTQIKASHHHPTPMPLLSSVSGVLESTRMCMRRAKTGGGFPARLSGVPQKQHRQCLSDHPSPGTEMSQAHPPNKCQSRAQAVSKEIPSCHTISRSPLLLSADNAHEKMAAG